MILVGPEFTKAYEGEKFKVFTDTVGAEEWLKKDPISEASILIKGSRGIALEKLLAYL